MPMLEGLAGLAMFTLMVVSALMGWRIVRKAVPLGTPEKWVGFALLLVCAGGFPLIAIAAALERTSVDTGLRIALMSAGLLIANAGLSSVFLFTLFVFRPDVPWLRWAVGLMIASLFMITLGTAHELWQVRVTPERIGAVYVRWTIPANIVAVSGLAWSAVEALRHHSLLRKRMRLGLADPLVANRMLLWATWSILVSVSTVFNLYDALQGIDPGKDPNMIAMSVVLGFGASGSLWLAFLPPKAWAALIRRRAEARRA